MALTSALAALAADLCALGFCVWQVGAPTASVDRGAGVLLGVAAGQSVPMTAAGPADGWHQLTAAMQTLAQSGQADAGVDLTFRRSLDEQRHVRAVLRRAGDDRIVAAVEDQTSRRRLDAERRAILATVPSAMLVIDGRGTIRTASATAERMFGWDATQLIGRPVSLMLPELQAMTGPEMVRHLAAGAIRRVNQAAPLQAIRADQSDFPAEIWIGDASTHGDALFTLFVRDHSNRIEMEATLQQLQNDLVHASRLSAMGELSLALAHEINQPLATLVNHLGIAEHYAAEFHSEAGKAIVASLGRATEQAMRAGEIVKRLRAFVERREVDMTIEHVDRVIGEAVSLLSSLAQRRGIALSLRLPGRGATVLADRVQLQQVIVNLMRNAMEALEQAGVPEKQLWVEAQVSQGEIEVAVEDNGPGVPADRQADLFAPFTTTKASGMGVGLSISRRIVEAHGGVLRQQRGEAGGARFSFILPLFKEFPRDA